MAKSSINIQPSSGNAIIHNERIFDVAYALKNDDVNEYHRFASISETRKAIYEDYKLHHGRKLNTKATPIREAVVNLNENHKMEDLINLSQMLENDYQMKVLHIAIHRDEGHIDKDGKENINYHAHLVFHNYDFDKHITIKRDKEVMRKLQTDVAKTLGMERGLENSQAVRLDHRQYKRAMQEVDTKTKDLKSELTKVKEENQELKKYDFKEMQKKITQLEELNSSQKKELHQLNSQVKNNKAEYEELLKKIDTLTVENKDLKFLTSTLAAESVENFEEAAKQKEKVNTLEKQNKALEEQLKAKEIDLETALKEVSNLKKSYTILESNYETSKNNNVSLISKNATLSIENKKLEKEIIDLKSLTKNLATESTQNFTEYQKVKLELDTLKTQNKSLQEQINTKPIQSIQNNQIEVLNYLKVESDLSQDFYSRIEKREFKTGLMSKEDFTIIKKQEVGTPTILEMIKSHFKKMYNSLNEKIRLLTSENANLKKANLDLRVENLKLTNENNKNKTLSITGEDKKENLLEKVKRINENEKILKEQMKKEKDQEQEKPKENINTKTQNYGYELR